MKSFIIKLLVISAGCFFLSYIAAKVGGLNSPRGFPQSVADKYMATLKEGTESSFQMALPGSESVEEIEIQTTRTDLRLEKGPSIVADLKGTFPGTAQEAFSSEMQGKKLIIRINEMRSGVSFEIGGGRELALKVPNSVKRIIFKTVSGDAAVKEFQLARLEMESTSGDITVEKGKIDNLSLKTVSGDLSCESCKLGTYKGSSVSGDQRLKVLQGEDITVDTTSGDTEIQLAQKPVGQLVFSSTSGEMALEPSFGKFPADSHREVVKLGDGLGKSRIIIHSVSGDARVGKL